MKIFEVKVKYDKIDNETGKEKKVNLPYVIDAVSFYDAEKRISEIFEKEITGNFEITAIKVTNYSEIIANKNGGYWFKCKVIFIEINPDTGNEKKVSYFYLVESESLEDARNKIDEYLKDSVCDIKIHTVTETNVQDYFN